MDSTRLQRPGALTTERVLCLDWATSGRPEETVRESCRSGEADSSRILVDDYIAYGQRKVGEGVGERWKGTQQDIESLGPGMHSYETRGEDLGYVACV